MLQFMCGQGLSDMASNAEGLTADAREKIETLADHARSASQVILQLAGMSRQVWVPVSMSLVRTTCPANQGPPTVTGVAPGYQAFVDLACCLEPVRVIKQRDQVRPSAAMRFMTYEPHGPLSCKQILFRRPELEAFVYKVRILISFP